MSAYRHRLKKMKTPITTRQERTVRYGWSRKSFVIPMGTPVVPCNNLPEGGFWIVGQSAWPDEVYSWAETYGFHIPEDEL